MNSRNQIVLNALLLGALTALPAVAYSGNGDGAFNQAKVKVCARGSECAPARKAGCAHKGKRSFKKLSLSDDQLEKIGSLKNQYLTAAAPEKAELKAMRRQLGVLITQAPVDRDKVTSLQSRIDRARADLDGKRLDYRLGVLSVLTPEQRQELRHRMLIGEAFGGQRHRFEHKHIG